jgi:hypothetical protein
VNPEEHYRIAVRLAELAVGQDGLEAVVSAISANTHAVLATGRDFGFGDELLRQAEVDLENARQTIRHLENLLGDKYAEQINTDSLGEPPAAEG